MRRVPAKIKIGAKSKSQVSTVRPYPPAVGGLNARDSYAAMKPEDAVTMQDWFPLTSEVMLRKGYTRFAHTFSGQSETGLPYAGGTINKFFTVTSGGNVYDITAGGAVGAAAVSGLSNGRFQHTNITTTGGSYLLMVNGADKQRIFDGTSWHTDGDGAPYDVTGFNTQNAHNICLFKNRIWLVEKNTLKVWYLPINAIGGAATSLDFSSIAQRGGYLVAMATWTVDGGNGIDDLAVFATSKGEFLIYQLTDPSTPSGIALKGVWHVAPPIGKRCFLKWGGDLLVITLWGILPLGKFFLSPQIDSRVALTDKIRSAITDAATNYGANFGWQLCHYPKAGQLYLNVPVAEGSSQQQYVMNTQSDKQPWGGPFTGYAANWFEIFNDEIYFGANGYVGRAWNTFTDNNSQIQGALLQAFSNFGTEQQKKFTMFRPILRTNGSPSIFGGINVDFDTTISTAALSFTAANYAAWDTAVWDTDVWGGGLNVQKQWQEAAGLGVYGAPQLVVRSSGIETHWANSDIAFEEGGVIGA